MIRTCKLIIASELDGSRNSCFRFETDQPKNASDWIMTIAVDSRASYAVLLTAHNALQVTSLQHSKWGIPSDSTISGVETLLYSGNISIIDDNHFLIASGTVFGEVLFWTCSRVSQSDQWSVQTKHVFLGHRGSIFGVSISHSISFANKNLRFLASCSDDRTIRIWDVSETTGDINTPLTNGYLTSDTGFSEERDQDAQLTVAWGHLSRIWDVYFLNANEGEDKPLVHLVTRGEDSACNYWELSLHQIFDGEGGRGALRLVDSDRHHSGKNIWSFTQASQPESPTISTGGSDGQIVSRSFGSNIVARVSVRFRDMVVESRKGSVKAIKQYLAFQGGSIITTTDSGMVLHGSSTDITNWSVAFKPLKPSITTLCTNTASDLAIWCVSPGTLFVFDTSTCSLSSKSISPQLGFSQMRVAHTRVDSDGVRTVYVLANIRGQLRSMLLKITYKKDILEVQTLTVCMPSEFVSTSALYHPERQLLICGSRAGAIAIFRSISFEIAEVDACICVRHVHGSDTVTSIMVLPRLPDNSNPELLYLLTTGRDGTYAIHLLKDSLQSHTPVILETVHIATPPIGPYIEGAYLEHDGVGDHDLLLYGFKSTDFVVWSVTHQMQILSVDCGGAHRSWDYHPYVHRNHLYVWTKAGVLNQAQKSRGAHRILQHGGHGREIKSLATTQSSKVLDQGFSMSDASVIVATGAEDTTIRLFEYTPNSTACIAVMRHHTTGPQALKFSTCGRYLFSSGGIEEFVVWKLNEAPTVRIGTVAIGQLPKSEDDDARIMGFDIVNASSKDTSEPRFLILMAYSTGRAKLSEYIPNTSGLTEGFRTLQQLNIGTLCLTQTMLLSDETGLSALIGSTDGFLRFSKIDEIDGGIVSHRVHQSNIAGMATHKIATDSYLIATGGDDNALGLTLLQTRKEQGMFETILIPKAHAAALTSVGITTTEADKSILVVSAGNDQKVKLWRVTMSPHDQEISSLANIQPSDIQVGKVGELWTDVADVSNLEILGITRSPLASRSLEVLIVGVGIQTVRFEMGDLMD